jgi:hypothetical protein
MRGILINPFSKTVSEVEYSGDYNHISELLDCEIYTLIRLARDEVLFIDDEGLIVDKPQAFFAYKGYLQPLAGLGLVLGTDPEGETVATMLTVDQVRDKVTFPAVEVAGWTSVETSTEESWLGKIEVIRGPQPIFEPLVPTEGSEERH